MGLSYRRDLVGGQGLMGARVRRRSLFSLEPPEIASTVAVWWATDLNLADTDPVGSWVDRVNGVTITSSSTARPLFDIDGINGRPSVLFDGVNDNLSLTASDALTNSTQGCIVAVVSVSSPSSDNRFWSTADTATTNYYLLAGHWSQKLAIGTDGSPGGLGLHGVQSTSANVQSATPMAAEWSATGTSWTIRANNLVEALTIAIGTNRGVWFGGVPNRDIFAMGCLTRTTSQSFYSGQIAYFGVFDEPLSIGDRDALYAWIELYYGVPVA